MYKPLLYDRPTFQTCIQSLSYPLVHPLVGSVILFVRLPPPPPPNTLSLTLSPSPSILEVKLLRVWPQRLLEHSRVEALLEHVDIHTTLVLEPDSLSIGVSVERVHQHNRNVAAICPVHVLREKQTNTLSKMNRDSIHVHVTRAHETKSV